MSKLRASCKLLGFAGLTLPLMPLQALFLRLSPSLGRRFPQWYHRQLCRLLGVRIHFEGDAVNDKAVLIVANHSSWLDIPVVSAVAPVSFIAKKEVGTWPFVSSLARLQRTVFVDRERRTSVGGTTAEILNRLRAGDSLVLFPEGTSSDGNRVLPFKTSLFAAAKPSALRAENRKAARAENPTPANHQVVVQTLTIVYTRLCGISMLRSERPIVGWYGDMEMAPHAWQFLQAGPVDVVVRIGQPVPMDAFMDRKALARYSEEEIRREHTRILRGAAPEEPPKPVERPPEEEQPAAAGSGAKLRYG